MTRQHDILADRLNTQPSVFRGCSVSELGVMAGLATLCWVPGSVLIAWLAGAMTMGFGAAGLGIVATVFVLAGVFERLKRNRPDGYYQQRVILWLDERGLRQSGLIHRSGVWDVGRSDDASLPTSNR